MRLELGFWGRHLEHVVGGEHLRRFTLMKLLLGTLLRNYLPLISTQEYYFYKFHKFLITDNKINQFLDSFGNHHKQ